MEVIYGNQIAFLPFKYIIDDVILAHDIID